MMRARRGAAWFCVISLLLTVLSAVPCVAMEETGKAQPAEISLDLSKASSPLKLTDYEGQASVWLAGEGDAAEWTVVCPAAGRYALSVLYRPVKDMGNGDMEAALSAEGQEASVILDRIYENEGGVTEDFPLDERGDQRRPVQTQWYGWRETTLDAAGTLELSGGTHVLRLEMRKGRAALAKLTLKNITDAPTYAAYVEEMRAHHPADAARHTVRLEGEAARWKSQSNLYPLTDRSSADTSPNDASHAVLNTIGGANWKTEGSWLEWQFTVPADGFYTFSMRCRQHMNLGMNTYRRVTIDGVLPFQELAAVCVESDNRWQNVTLGDGKNPYRLYLTAGEHTLRMTVTLGAYDKVVSSAETLLVQLNAISRVILSVTGVEPDIYRDYSFPEAAPELIPDLRSGAKALKELGDEAARVSGGYNEGTSVFRQLSERMQHMADNHRAIAKNFSAFKNEISSLGTWVKNVNNQPLELDYLAFGAPDDTAIFQNVSLWRHICFAMTRFFESFTSDYNTFRTDDDAGQLIVWAGTGLISGSDQVNLLRTLIANRYTAGAVSLKLVAADALLPATLAQMGPDVALQLGEPLDYGIRHAVRDLSAFADAPEVLRRFHPSAYEPFSFDGKLYAIPETQNYPVLFYRKDILKDLGIDAAKLDTWEDILQGVLPELQKQYMDFGLMPTLANYLMLLYQAGGTVYTAGGMHSTLNTAEAIQAFSDFTELYDSYRIPVTFDFANRFRSGEMPVAIVDFTIYNQLAVFAPEIRGLWGMKQVPGTKAADGSICRAVAGTSGGCVILASSDKPDKAWEFIKWWTSADIQAAFGNDLEDSLGDAARYPTANLEAVSLLKWDADSLETLGDQRRELRAVPQVPGSYITTRYFEFAFRDIVYQGKDVRETLNSTVSKIDRELLSKREEFHLPTTE